MESSSSKILFVITSSRDSNSGFGGHYYSLLTYVEVLKTYFNIYILHYSEEKESILDQKIGDSPFYIKTNNIDSFDIEKINPRIVIFFGASYIKTYSLKHKLIKLAIPVIGLKPGGKKPKYYPFYDYIICFSKNDYDWFTNYYTFNKVSNIIYLPNRVLKHPPNYKRIDQLSITSPTQLNLLRVSRINNTYYESFIKTINLHKKLKKNNINVNTVIVGNCEDISILNRLYEIIINIPNITILTDSKYTNNAVELIPLFNVVAGIGRGFMEAVAQNTIVLGFSKSYDIPVLVDKTNYYDFKKNNFSLRVEWIGGTEEEEYLKIIKTLNKSTDNLNYMYKKFLDDYDAMKIIYVFKKTFYSRKLSFIYKFYDWFIYYNFKLKIFIRKFYSNDSTKPIRENT